MYMNYGHLELRIEELLKERDISKNTICKELDIPRSNFNRYCRNEFQRLDANLICKLCNYFECEMNEIIDVIRNTLTNEKIINISDLDVLFYKVKCYINRMIKKEE